MSSALETFLKTNRELCEAASAGPWESVNNGSRRPNLLFNFNVESAGAANGSGDPVIIAEDLKEKNAALISASRTSLPLALEMLEACREQLEFIAGGHGTQCRICATERSRRYRDRKNQKEIRA